jgi:hypothetical protein
VTGTATGSLGATSSALGALDANGKPAGWAFRGPPFGPTIPGLAAVPPPSTRNSPALPCTADEVVLAETLGQVATGIRKRSSLDCPMPPASFVAAQGPQGQQQLQEHQYQYQYQHQHPHPHHQQPHHQHAAPDPYGYEAGQEQAAQQEQQEGDEGDLEDGASVLEALEIMVGGTKGEVPVLMAELETIFAHDEGPPSFEHEHHFNLAHGEGYSPAPYQGVGEGD